MNGYIFSEMKRYRRKFLIILLVLIALWVPYVVANSPYILNRFIEHPKLDLSHFLNNTQNVEVGEPFKLHKTDNLKIPDYALKGSSYWKGDRYEFVVPVSSFTPLNTQISNKDTYTGNGSSPDMTSALAWITQVGDKNVLVITYPDFTGENVTEVTGIFTDIPLIMKSHLANNFIDNPDYEVCQYMLDTRGIEMESEAFDVLFSSIFLAIIIFLAIKLVLQYINPHRTPTYKQVAKYGDIEITETFIEKELKDAKFADKQYFCENWIVSKSTFGLKIVKNHIKHGSFKY